MTKITIHIDWKNIKLAKHWMMKRPDTNLQKLKTVSLLILINKASTTKKHIKTLNIICCNSK